MVKKAEIQENQFSGGMYFIVKVLDRSWRESEVRTFFVRPETFLERVPVYNSGHRDGFVPFDHAATFIEAIHKAHAYAFGYASMLRATEIVDRTQFSPKNS